MTWLLRQYGFNIDQSVVITLHVVIEHGSLIESFGVVGVAAQQRVHHLLGGLKHTIAHGLARLRQQNFGHGAVVPGPQGPDFLNGCAGVGRAAFVQLAKQLVDLLCPLFDRINRSRRGRHHIDCGRFLGGVGGSHKQHESEYESADQHDGDYGTFRNKQKQQPR